MIANPFVIKRVYIHDSNILPVFSKNILHSVKIQNSGFSFSVLSKLNIIKRLEAPYDTNCVNYDNFKTIKSREHCINNCYIETLTNKFKCFNEYLYDFASFANIENYTNFKKCDSVINESLIDMRECHNRCKFNCIEKSFISVNAKGRELSSKRNVDEITFEGRHHMNFNYLPQMTFFQYLITFGGLLSLWSGMSFIHMKVLIFYAFNKIHMTEKFGRLHQRNIFKYCFEIKKLLSKIKILVCILLF